MSVHPLDDVRGLQEEAEEKARWTLIVREQITRTLLATGYFFADDLHALGVPYQHSAVIGSQTASFAAQKYMEAFTRRKVEHAAANGRKANVYRITEKGREELSKLAGVSAESAREPGPMPDVAPDGHRASDRCTDSGETLSLFPDPEAWAA